ncbi:MAG: hypothetical protein ACYSW7_12105 [Planctomycetota bacterium]|jgi:hypothetical protein
MNRKELVERFCKVLNEAKIGPFEKTVYSEIVFIDEAKAEEIEILIRELEKLS